jgi:predicted SnoaL-like aldol condensation-catalyzing enzyme
MKTKTVVAGWAIVLAGFQGAIASAQAPPAPVQANPAVGCKVSPKVLEENRQLGFKFFKVRGAERVAMADPAYIQHNPVFKKRALEAHESDYDEFKKTFLNMPPAPPPPAPDAGPQPPAGNNYEVVMAECDLVTMVRKIYRQDPTAAPGTFYESFTFDTFRVKNGKLVEHWDAALITAPGK